MEREYRAIICPVCKEFFFSELSEDEKKNGYNTNNFRCNVCGWKYNLSQVDNNLLVDEEGVSLEEAIESFKEKRAKDPKYNYLDYCCKNKKKERHLCPVCGKYQFKDKESYDICPYCGWEDDGYFEGGGANFYSLEESRKIYLENVKNDPNYRWEENNK